MKRLIWLVVLAGVATGFTGCHKRDKNAQPHKTYYAKKERVKKERVKKEHHAKARYEKRQHAVVDEA